jgi:plastocyanin
VDLASNIVNFKLEDLTLPVGTTVTWINRDVPFHTTTSGIPAGPSGVWDSPVLLGNSSFSFKFTEQGTFSYYCRLHPSFMQASVSVGPPGTTVSAAPHGAVVEDSMDGDDSDDSDY